MIMRVIQIYFVVQPMTTWRTITQFSLNVVKYLKTLMSCLEYSH